MKCPECGCDFEGNFCPNCGAGAGEVTRCPVCGKERTNNERFCSGCGYAYEKPEQEKDTDEPVTLYKLLSFAPLILFAGMAVLAFIFSIAPTVSGWFSINAYGLLGDDTIDGMQGTAIFLLITEIIFLIIAAITACLIYKNMSTGDNRVINILKLCNVASAVYYLILLITSIVMCALIAAYDEGAGAFTVGACPILFIVFSLLFGIAETACVAIKLQLKKKYPQLTKVKTGGSALITSTGGTASGATIKKERTPLNAKTKKKITIFSVLLAVVIIAVIMIVFVVDNLSNIFRVGKVSQINIGDSKSQVESILGSPYEDGSTDSKWIYYSSEYTDIIDELTELDKKYENATSFSELENLLEQETELYERLSAITYKTITINFEESSDSKTTEYVVSSVWLDTDCCEDYITETKKTLKSVTILSGAFEQYSTSTTVEITYEAKFTDGSYIKNSATANRDSSGTITTIDNISITWSDKWHSSYYQEIEVEEKGYYVDNETGDDDNSYNVNGNILYITSDSLLYLTEMSSSEKAAITEVIISEGVTRIYGNINDSNTAFYGFTSLQKITIPDTVTSIGWGAFLGCTSLESISIPDSVISIDEYAFNFCTSLESVYIGSGLSEIGDWALENCTALKSITVSLDNTAFKSIDGNLYSHDEKTLIQYAIGKTDSSFTIPSSVTTICNGAFAYCQYLTEVTISKNVTSIEYIAFMECSNLKNVTFENTSGWYVVDYDYDYKENSRKSISVTSASKNATYFKDTYCYYYWYRS